MPNGNLNGKINGIECPLKYYLLFGGISYSSPLLKKPQ